MMEIDPLLVASGYRTWRNIPLTHGSTRVTPGADVLVPQESKHSTGWDAEELFFMGLPDQAQNATIPVVSAMLAVRWLEANVVKTEQEMAVPTPEQLSRVSISKRLDLFKTICKILRIPKEIERVSARQRLMPWFRAVMTSWMYERAKRRFSRNREAD